MSVKMKKAIFILLGTLFLCLGVLGIFIPGLPTTPFLLLTAALYVRSSERLYQALVSNRYLGKYILDYREKGGMTLKVKLYSMAMMWTMILLSCVFFVSSPLARLLILFLGIIGTVVMGFCVPTVK